MNELELLKKKLLKNKKFKKEFNKYNLAYEVAKMITEARIIKGVTQERLAKLMRTKQASIARAESGRNLPSLSFLNKIANAFHTRLITPKFEFMEDKIKLSSVSVYTTKQEDWNVNLVPYTQNNSLFALYSGSGNLSEDLLTSRRNYFVN